MENNVNKSVCFFDSGIGGLNLLSKCVGIMPRTDFTYFADNYRVPYGAMSKDELIERADQIFGEIEKLSPSAAVVACNTVTAQCIDYLRGKYSFEILGIQPAVKPAIADGGRCLVLATPATAESASLKQLIDKLGARNITVAACDKLAAYIEKNIGNFDTKEVKAMLPRFKAESVVLGCTHYIFVKEIIKDFYNCPVYDGIDGTATNLKRILGISDHPSSRAQKISFIGGDEAKNRRVFGMLLKQSGSLSRL
ncbi:MAG TPA: hypothetical protein DD415_06840 [Clostridiales bacterium]|nr:hypothetical protein [Clostridiales bacterium]